jgi:hypothetical protein
LDGYYQFLRTRVAVRIAANAVKFELDGPI